MSNENEEIKDPRGGAREGSGRKPGITKSKFCVSVDKSVLRGAVKRFKTEPKPKKKKTSRLVEILLDRYGSRRISLGVLP